jgi:hypothetical protein
MAAICTAGHAIAGEGMFYSPIKSTLHNALQAAVFTGMWHIITVNFALSALALTILGVSGQHGAVAWFIAAQFAGYAAIYLVLTLRLGSPLKLFQWVPFAMTAILAALAA